MHRPEAAPPAGLSCIPFHLRNFGRRLFAPAGLDQPMFPFWIDLSCLSFSEIAAGLTGLAIVVNVLFDLT